MTALKHGIDLRRYGTSLDRLLSLLAVADFPMKYVIRFLVAIFAKNGSLRIGGLMRIDHYGQLVVVDLHEIGHVGR